MRVGTSRNHGELLAHRRALSNRHWTALVFILRQEPVVVVCAARDRLLPGEDPETSGTDTLNREPAGRIGRRGSEQYAVLTAGLSRHKDHSRRSDRFP